MITEALKTIASCLNEAGIQYMVIGGQAVAQYGENRFTEDIDITLALIPDEIDVIRGPLKSCGFHPIPEDYHSFLIRTWVLPVEHTETKARVYLIFSVIPFERTAINNAIEISIDGVPVKFISAEDLVIQKIFSGRPRDIEDAAGIIRLNKGRIDLKNIRESVEALSREISDSSLLDRLSGLMEFFD